jgi:hypothetical protein
VVHNLPLIRHKETTTKAQALIISKSICDRETMLVPARSENKKILTQELRTVARPWPAFDRDLSAKIGKCIAVRRTLCRLSRQQLGARLGIDSVDVEAYEQGEKRMSCKLLLDTAKQLKATPRFFFG